MASPLYLTLMIGPIEAVPVPKPVMDALTSVEVHVSATGKSGFQLVFTLSNSSPLTTFFLLTQGSSAPLIRVILMVTFGGLPQVLMDGIITRTDVVPDAMSGSSQLNVTGEDLTAVMNLVDFSGLPYPGMLPNIRVDTILAKYAMFGINSLALPPLAPDVELPIDKIRSHKGTDLDYVQELARECGYVFYIVPGPAPGVSQAYWGPQVKIGVPQPALNVNMDTWTNVESLNFNYEPQTAKTPIVYFQDQNSKQPIEVPIPTVNPLDPPLGVFVPIPQGKDYLTDTAKSTPAQAFMIGLARASELADVVSGDGTVNVVRYGQILQARQLVGVRGAGMAFDGLYYVDTVRHNMKMGEFKTSFTLKRNALVANLPAVPTMAF